MADQIFTVKSGFYDAINGDRKYSAEDMNKPYSRVVADGVFATQEGTPSSDLQVVASGTGMIITVQAGQAIIGGKWFENTSPIMVTVPANTALYSRLDSVIMRVDKRTSGRTGAIVYRTGTAAQEPTAPEITQTASLMEYRLANIIVGPSTTAILQSQIVDLRGTETPWVTSLIQQVDTSTLFAQYQAAFAEQYARYTEEYQAYKAQQQADWSAFIQTITEDLDVTMNMLELKRTYETSSEESQINIGISAYVPSTDILEVYINGLKESNYTSDGTKITLSTPLEAGNTVEFRVLKAVIGGDISSIASVLQRIEEELDSLIKFPAFPVSDGTYTLKLVVSGGSATMSWVAQA